jgi:hypothetical protein
MLNMEPVRLTSEDRDLLPPEAARDYFAREDIDFLRTLGPRLEKVRAERADAERKLREFDSRARTLAEHQAERRHQAVEEVMGGKLEISIPVIESSSDVMREAHARLKAAIRIAEEAERDIVALYRAHLATTRVKAQRNAYRQATKNAEGLKRSLAAVAALDDLPGEKSIGPAELHGVMVPGLVTFAPPVDRRQFPTGLTGERTKLLDATALGDATTKALAGLHSDLNAVVGPAGENFWSRR